ncbi:hypothetical protein HK405_003539, partial [Cladochytrium tenue]
DDEGAKGHIPGTVFPHTPGHEVVGRIVRAGAQVPARLRPGSRVGVGWSAGYCFECDACRHGEFACCTDRTGRAGVTGITRDGGMAEYLVARHSALALVPEGPDAAELAPMMCAGVTVFNSIRNMGVRPGDLVAVQGLGGLGHLAVQVCAKMGLRVVALTSRSGKADLAASLGATEAVAGDAAAQAARLQALGGAKLIVATAPNAAAIEPLVAGLGLYGTLLLLAVPLSMSVSVPALVHHRARVMGWNSGHAGDSEETIAFCSAHGVKCHVERFSIDQVNAGFAKMLDGSVRFRSVLVIGN